jgi:TolB-like protein
MSLFAELKRRNVIRVGLAYVVAGWLLVQVLEIAADSFEAPAWVMKFAITVIAVALVPTLIFSWVYEITPEGIKREVEVERTESVTAETGQKLNVAVIVLLVLAIGLFAVDRFLLDRSSAPAEPVAQSVQAPASSAPTAGESAVDDTAREGPGTAKVEEQEASPAREASVAVLPFTTRSANDDDRYFSDGVHDDLLTQLAKIGSLKVISRTSVMDYRETTKRIPDIAAELGVATVVEGAVQRSGSKVRITAQLIDARTDEHLWAESYDRALTADNLFDIQTEIATSIAGALQATLSPEEKAALQRRLTDDLPAREAYQRARWLLFSLTADSVQTAEKELDFALQRDPEFAAAWALQAQVQLAYHWWGIDRTGDRRERARAAIDRGRAIDPSLPELDIAEGYYFYWGFRNYRAALELLEPALAAYPNDAELRKLVAFVNRRYGRFDLTLEHLERALELDPRSRITITELGQTNGRLGRYERAEHYADMLRQIDPGDPQGRWIKAMVARLRDGDASEALRHWDAIQGQLLFALAGKWVMELASGDYASAVESARRIDEQDALRGPEGYPTGMTLYYAGDLENARPVLRKALGSLTPEMEQASSAFGSGLIWRCHLLGALGDADGAREACARARDDKFDDAFNLPDRQLSIAGGMAMAGLNTEAFELLGSAIQGPVGIKRNQLKLEPALRRLHDDPRWTELLEEASL